LTIAGIFVLRKNRPDAERPYRAFGYPVLPALYIVSALAIMFVLLLYKTQTTWPGLVIVLIEFRFTCSGHAGVPQPENFLVGRRSCRLYNGGNQFGCFRIDRKDQL